MNYEDKSVCCPFYCKTEPCKICCEGFCKGTHLHTFFENKELKLSHKKKYCDNLYGYTLCPLYNVIYKQYREE